MFARSMILTMSAFTFCHTSASAQYGYGGYLSFDNDAYLAPLQRIVAEADARAEQSVQQLMRMPEVQQRYQEFRQAGGTLHYHAYVTWFARTAGFTPQGVQRYIERERQQISEQRQRVAELNDANEVARRNMLEGMNRAYHRNKEMGDVIAGNKHYTDADGRNYVLPFTRPGYHKDSSGRVFHLDQWGKYHLLNDQGYWMPLRQK